MERGRCAPRPRGGGHSCPPHTLQALQQPQVLSYVAEATDTLRKQDEAVRIVTATQGSPPPLDLRSHPICCNLAATPEPPKLRRFDSTTPGRAPAPSASAPAQADQVLQDQSQADGLPAGLPAEPSAGSDPATHTATPAASAQCVAPDAEAATDTAEPLASPQRGADETTHVRGAPDDGIWKEGRPGERTCGASAPWNGNDPGGT